MTSEWIPLFFKCSWILYHFLNVAEYKTEYYKIMFKILFYFSGSDSMRRTWWETRPQSRTSSPCLRRAWPSRAAGPPPPLSGSPVVDRSELSLTHGHTQWHHHNPNTNHWTAFIAGMSLPYLPVQLDLTNRHTQIKHTQALCKVILQISHVNNRHTDIFTLHC